MKVAVLADIHSNLIGFQAVIEHIEAWGPDQVIFGGDIVNRGPRPLECLELLLTKEAQDGWLSVRGNHEDYVVVHSRPNAPRSGILFEIHQNAYWTYQKLGEDVTALERMPFQQSINGPDGSEVRVVHASMLGNRNGIFPRTSDEDIREKMAPPPTVLCVGHTHWPLIRHVDETLVVNVGSAGLPFDGDDRLSYAQLVWQNGDWQAEIIRLPYDKDKNEQDFHESGFLTESGPLAPLVLNELHTAHPRLYRWTVENEEQVLAGEITPEAAVAQFLEKIKSQ